MAKITDNRPLLTEPVPIFETFVTGVANAENCGDFLRLTFFVDRPVTRTPATERAVVARLVVPQAFYRELVDDLAAATPEVDLAAAR